MLKFITEKMIGSQNDRTIKRLQARIEAINALEADISSWTDERFAIRTQALQQTIQAALADAESSTPELQVVPGDLPIDQRKDARDNQRTARRRVAQEVLDYHVPEAFAMVREVSKRTIGLRHYDVQMIGGMVLHNGSIAEMTTGEGKTLVATLAAYLNALTGRGVHVVTVNDYLARRDREWMGPIYEFFGLTVGAIQHDISDEERQHAYGCDITYGTNNEFGFDYLRDNMKYRKESMVHRDFHFAIVDEVDSILVDEARTPLIISGPSEESTDLYYQLDRVARQLQRAAHFTIDEKAQSVALTEEGIAKAEEILHVQNLYDYANQRYVHHLAKALEAHHLRKVDVDYVLKDQEIMIVDEFTGRLMPGRRWSDGLHQAIEAKEGVKIQQENQTLATITFQNYFRMYQKLSGMTGTAYTEADELKEIYNIEVVVMPTNRPLIRESLPDQVYRTEAEKFVAVVLEIVHWHRQGRPLLVGTIAIDKSEFLSQMLSSPHVMMDAVQRQAVAAKTSLESLSTKRPGWLTEPLQQSLMQVLSRPAQLQLTDVDPLLQQLEQVASKEALTDAMGRLAARVDAVEVIRGGIPNRVLNAKQHEREAHTIAQAGHLGGVTIATNMAGRGTDILLGGNPEFLAADAIEQRQRNGDTVTEEERAQLLNALRERSRDEHANVVALGGLHVIGTERHEARRIDNQLRGRSGRQGDPGSSRFYLSLEDDLMRIFAPDRIKKLMDFFQWEDGVPIEHGFLTKSIETAQKRVEVHNFEIRKQVLKYDDVMNRQREVIYAERRRVLTEPNLRAHIEEIIADVSEQAIDQFVNVESDADDWDLSGLRTHLHQRFGVDCPWLDQPHTDRDALAEELYTAFIEAYSAKELTVGAEAFRYHEHGILLQMIDTKWKDHLYAMDSLREGIGLRGYGQRDPLVEYKREGFEMFQTMVDGIKEDALALLLRFDVAPMEAQREQNVFDPARQQMLHPAAQSFPGQGEQPPTPGRRATSQRRPPSAGAASDAITRAMAGSAAPTPKVGRNDPCPCGSGKKYKRCHG